MKLKLHFSKLLLKKLIIRPTVFNDMCNINVCVHVSVSLLDNVKNEGVVCKN